MGALFDYIASRSDADRAALEELFGRMPGDLESRVTLGRLKNGNTLIRMGQPASLVYLLLEGSVKGLNEKRSGLVYAFADFEAPGLFGEFEAFAGSPFYRGTLACAVDCLVGSIPMERYLGWMKRDPAALFSRTRAITRLLLKQTGTERSFRFLSGADRLLLYLIACYERGGGGSVTLSDTRQQIADRTGFCTKTVQRALRTLREAGCLSIVKGRVTVTAEQYERLREFEARRISDDNAINGGESL